MTDQNKSQLLQEPLINKGGADGGQGQKNFTITREELCDLFHPDNIDRKSKEDPNVSISVYKLWHDFGGAQGLATKLKTNLKNGILGSKEDIDERIQDFGSNANQLAETKTLFGLIIECFEDLMLKILLLAAFVALVIGIINDGLAHGWIEGASIFFAVGIIVTVTAGNNYMKEKQFQKLKARQQDNQNAAIFRGREGNTITRSTQELVVGDIIKIEQGQQVPADCLVISANDLVLNESAQTGEPKDKDKVPLTEENYHQDPTPFLLAKTFVKSGEGLAIVCAVGIHTRAGMAGQKLDMETGLTPLQQKLETIANQIGKVGLSVAILTFLIMSIKYVITEQTKELDPRCDQNPLPQDLKASDCKRLEPMELLSEIVHYFIIAITVVVVAMPEGLPLAVTISLAYSVMKMKQENNLVRKLEASETMGGADQICTDKTGTLTKNEMTVRGLWTMDKSYINGDIDNVKLNDISCKDLLATGVLFNSSARVELNPKNNQLEVNGNCTEQGLISYLMKEGIPAMDLIKKKSEELPNGMKRVLESIPFNSSRKKQTTAILLPEDENVVRVFVKGAPDFVLDDCTQYINASGQPVQLTDDKKNDIIHNIIKNQFAFNAFRTLLISYVDLSLADFTELKNKNNLFAKEKDREVLEKQGLTVIGIYGLQDPLRDEIVDSVQKCYNAGITIRMVTGDNLDTARAIARNAGILRQQDENNQYACMEGKQFRELVGLKQEYEGEKVVREKIRYMDNFKKIEPHLRVLARSTPEDKYILVTGLQELNKVVAVTGDGTNDAPALKKADVGFAMGIAGTEVAKDASDIIILDDNFASIVTAIKWGRNIYQNVRKFLQFQLTVNVVAMFIVFVGSVVLRDPPLTSVQMLWVNLIMDTCGALALATEPPSDKLLNKRPYPRNESIVKATMIRNIIGQALYQISVLLVLLFAGQTLFEGCEYPEDSKFYVKNQETGDVYPYVPKLKHYTMIFNSFVFMQIFNEINSRKLGKSEFNVFAGFFNNLLFLTIVLSTVGIQVAMVQYGGASVRTTPISIEEHLICLAIGMGSLVNGLLIKLILPVKWFNWVKIKEEPMKEEDALSSVMSTVRKPTLNKSMNKSKVVDSAPAQGAPSTTIN